MRQVISYKIWKLIPFCLEDEIRFNIFKSNILKAQLYQVFERGSAIYGVTPYSDLTS